MLLFRTDSLKMCYEDLEAARQWWVQTFDCRQVSAPAHWTYLLPSDVVLAVSGALMPVIVLSSLAEEEAARLERADEHPILFTNDLRNAREFLARRGLAPGPIQSGAGPQYFLIRDPEGNAIEICEEP